jgi:hypothetical protein
MYEDLLLFAGDPFLLDNRPFKNDVARQSYPMIAHKDPAASGSGACVWRVFTSVPIACQTYGDGAWHEDLREAVGEEICEPCEHHSADAIVQALRRCSSCNRARASGVGAGCASFSNSS